MNCEKVYLFVPFEYKDNVKEKGAKFDFNNKKWYILRSNPNYQYLVDTYHQTNFRTDFYGVHLVRNPSTEEERNEKKNKPYDKWHSVNISGRE